MSILEHFPTINLSPGQETALTKLEAFLDSPAHVFMLKGYAGSGKTTILKGLVAYLNSNKKNVQLMEPTGRAAKVLRDKAGMGSTIHKGIYNFSKPLSINKDSVDEATHSIHYYFPINKMEHSEMIIIVDESSMISSKESKHELFTFGTNVLLSDLLTFSKLQTTNNKLILVGDPAQLPPVGDNRSLALDKDYFEQLGISVEETEMTEVLRQGNNLILQNASKLRHLLTLSKRSHLTFEYDESSFIKTSSSDIIDKYSELFPQPEIGNGIVISFSNAQCFHTNNAIRNKIFPDQPEIAPGDLVLINNNNYHSYGVELFNGDIAKVIEVSPKMISQSAPVYYDEGGTTIRRIIKLDFRLITIRVPSHSDEIKCYIIESLLHSIDRDLSLLEMKALYINFVIRFNEEQRIRREAGKQSFKVGSEEFRQALKVDPFYNALKVKYGYAITCHKAQGGEWDKVFIDYHGRVSLRDEPIRWCYTATTRGINTVYAVNAPHFGKFDKFKIGPIGTIGTLPSDALAFNDITVSPFHRITDHKCKSQKYWEIVQKLENTPFQIKKVETFGYLERYTVANGDKELQIEAYHKISGHFTSLFKVVTPTDHHSVHELERIFNSSSEVTYSINYTPEFPFLDDLLSRVQDACTQLKIPVTNIQKGANYFVTYYLKTDALCSYIQFYYNNQQQLTSAMPKAYNCTDDKKLQALIKSLIEYAS